MDLILVVQVRKMNHKSDLLKVTKLVNRGRWDLNPASLALSQL